MTRLINLILILFVLSAGSCSTRKNRLDHTQIIPENDLISILTEVYITDGLLNIPNVHHMFVSLDSISTYFQIFEKHGYSKETMNNTIKYYFVKNPKKLIAIYDQVLGRLSEMESNLEREAALENANSRNLWKKSSSYLFPDNTIADSVHFNIKIRKKGSYTLMFTATFYPDDQTLNPGITLYSCHPDSLSSGKRNYIKSINYIKDGQPHNYTMILIVPKKKPLNFGGNLFDYDNNVAEDEKHATFENILILNTSDVI